MQHRPDFRGPITQALERLETVLANVDVPQLPAGAAATAKTGGKGKGSIQVFCRFRPPVEKDGKSPGSADPWWLQADRVCAAPWAEQMLGAVSFGFDRVFGPDASQAEIFDPIQDLVTKTLAGSKSAVLCYGQTAAGKTFTMEGPRDREESSQRGLVQRTLEKLFAPTEGAPGGDASHSKTVSISMLEIYMEKLRDLLAPVDEGADLQICADRTGHVSVRGMRAVVVNGLDEALQLVQHGQSQRHISATALNEHSSRSHSLVIIEVEPSGDALAIPQGKGKLCLVDLAGSECVKKAALPVREAPLPSFGQPSNSATGSGGSKILDEAKSINQSLSTLRLVIERLANKPAQGAVHIPYRSSKLTRVLQDVFTGGYNTTLILHCSPSWRQLTETTSTLRFGSSMRAAIKATPAATRCHKDRLLHVLQAASKVLITARARAAVQALAGPAMLEQESFLETPKKRERSDVTPEKTSRPARVPKKPEISSASFTAAGSAEGTPVTKPRRTAAGSRSASPLFATESLDRSPSTSLSEARFDAALRRHMSRSSSKSSRGQCVRQRKLSAATPLTPEAADVTESIIDEQGMGELMACSSTLVRAEGVVNDMPFPNEDPMWSFALPSGWAHAHNAMKPPAGCSAWDYPLAHREQQWRDTLLACQEMKYGDQGVSVARAAEGVSEELKAESEWLAWLCPDSTSLEKVSTSRDEEASLPADGEQQLNLLHFQSFLATRLDKVVQDSLMAEVFWAWMRTSWSSSLHDARERVHKKVDTAEVPHSEALVAESETASQSEHSGPTELVLGERSVATASHLADSQAASHSESSSPTGFDLAEGLPEEPVASAELHSDDALPAEFETASQTDCSNRSELGLAEGLTEEVLNPDSLIADAQAASQSESSSPTELDLGEDLAEEPVATAEPHSDEALAAEAESQYECSNATELGLAEGLPEVEPVLGTWRVGGDPDLLVGEIFAFWKEAVAFHCSSSSSSSGEDDLTAFTEWKTAVERSWDLIGEVFAEWKDQVRSGLVSSLELKGEVFTEWKITAQSGDKLQGELLAVKKIAVQSSSLLTGEVFVQWQMAVAGTGQPIAQGANDELMSEIFLQWKTVVQGGEELVDEVCAESHLMENGDATSEGGDADLTDDDGASIDSEGLVATWDIDIPVIEFTFGRMSDICIRCMAAFVAFLCVLLSGIQQLVAIAM